jgi:hypothetical protein
VSPCLKGRGSFIARKQLDSYIEIPQFSARNLKHHLDSELGALEVKFGPLPVGKPD